MDKEDPVQPVKEELKRRFQLAGRGSVGLIQQQLGLGKRFFSNQRRKGHRSFDLKMLLEALDALETEAAHFFGAVWGPADPVVAFRDEAAALLKKRHQPPPILVAEGQRSTDGTGSAAVDFSALDALRYDDPKLVKRRARELVSEVAGEDVPRLLGCHASACRVLGELDEAQVVLGRALELAGERHDDGAVAELVLRACAIVGERGELAAAHCLAERATLEHLRLGDSLGAGRSLADQGLWLTSMGRHHEALAVYQSALQFLEEDDSPEARRNRVCLRMNCAIIFQRNGDLEKAEAFAAAAQKDFAAVGKVLRGNVLTFRAAVARQRGDLDRAAECLRESIRIHAHLAPLETAYSVVELCRLQLERGHEREVYETTRILFPLLEQLEGNPVVSAYVTELLRCAVAGRGITRELLQRVELGLKKARAQRHAHRARG
jgi:tetratricopeptide (TPR) repeat protein